MSKDEERLRRIFTALRTRERNLSKFCQGILEGTGHVPLDNVISLGLIGAVLIILDAVLEAETLPNADQ